MHYETDTICICLIVRRGETGGGKFERTTEKLRLIETVDLHHIFIYDTDAIPPHERIIEWYGQYASAGNFDQTPTARLDNIQIIG